MPGTSLSCCLSSLPNSLLLELQIAHGTLFSTSNVFLGDCELRRSSHTFTRDLSSYSMEQGYRTIGIHPSSCGPLTLSHPGSPQLCPLPFGWGSLPIRKIKAHGIPSPVSESKSVSSSVVFNPLWPHAWTVAHHAPLSMGFSRQEYWSGLPFPSPRDLDWTQVSRVSGRSFTIFSYQPACPWSLRESQMIEWARFQ